MSAASCDLEDLVRPGDPATSLAAAAKALRASKRAIAKLTILVADGAERTDEECWLGVRALGLIVSPDVVRHARLAMAKAGLLVDTTHVGTTSEGCHARVWKTTQPVTRGAIELRDAGPANPRRAVAETTRALQAMERALVRLAEKLSDAIAAAHADVAAARAHGRHVAESAARVRLAALTDALKMLVDVV